MGHVRARNEKVVQGREKEPRNTFRMRRRVNGKETAREDKRIECVKTCGRDEIRRENEKGNLLVLRQRATERRKENV